jgi:uncharacterized protein with ParB-like and HNH nuclease domain
MKVSQEPVKINDILKESIFTIPLYQREYSWNIEQVSDLYYDILDSDIEGHFLGSLLLFKTDDFKKMEIVDGQQRLTTLFLLLFSISKKFQGTSYTKATETINNLLFIIDPYNLSNEDLSNEPRLEIGKRDKVLFKSIIRGENYDGNIDHRKKSHKNLINTINFFQDKISEIITKEGLDGLKSFLEKVIKCVFIVMTAEKESDKLLLFKTINARGKELTQGDLIKNELCRNISSVDLDESIDAWDEIRKKIENNDGNLDIFLFHYINSIDKCQDLRHELDKKRGIINWDKKNYPPVPEKYVFSVYVELILSETPKTFLNNLKQASDKYIVLAKPDASKTYLKSLKAMGVNKCFPLLLKSSRKLNEINFEKICSAIDSLTFRHSILRKDPKELEKFYYLTSELIRDDSNFDIVFSNIKNHQNYKEDDNFKEEFLRSNLKPSVSKMILDRITSKHSESVDWSNKDVHIEHIMPQKPAGEWKVLCDNDEFEYKEHLNRLGNLTILQDRINIGAGNKDFNDKKVYYERSRLKITVMLTNYPKWGYEEIAKRQEYLYEQSKDFWK